MRIASIASKIANRRRRKVASLDALMPMLMQAIGTDPAIVILVTASGTMNLRVYPTDMQGQDVSALNSYLVGLMGGAGIEPYGPSENTGGSALSYLVDSSWNHIRDALEGKDFNGVPFKLILDRKPSTYPKSKRHHIVVDGRGEVIKTIEKILLKIKELGSVGHSTSFDVDGDSVAFVDGDGSDKIDSIIIDDMPVEKRSFARTANNNDMRLQGGPGFHLQSDGTWAVEEVPSSVAENARFSAFLTIDGYPCAVFELNGEEWAQKAAAGVFGSPTISTAWEKETGVNISKIAARIAKCRRVGFAGPHGIDVEKFDMVEYAPASGELYPYGILAGEFVFKTPSGKTIRVRGRSDTQNQGFSIDVDGKNFTVDQDSAPDGMVYLNDLDPSLPDDGATIDDLIHEIAQSRLAARLSTAGAQVPAQRVVDRLYDSPYEWAWRAAEHIGQSGMSESEAIQYLYDEAYEAAWEIAAELEKTSPNNPAG